MSPTAGLTDEGYTGHTHNNLGNGADDLGLVYMNARYYIPGIGRFASADTIVPNPANPQSFNRYSYVNNNPLNFIDPFGHFGVCFQGGQADEPGTGFTEQICKDLADAGDFGPSKQYKVFANSNEGIEAARIYLFMMQKMYPDDPIVVLGYSWGGGAALEFVTFLNDHMPSIIIDALILIDPVLSGRDTLPELTEDYQTACSHLQANIFSARCPQEAGPIKFYMNDRSYYPVAIDENGNPIVPQNVKATLNLFADQAIIIRGSNPFDSGLQNIKGARLGILNIQMSETNHCSIAYQECTGRRNQNPVYGGNYNQHTYWAIRGFLAEAIGH